VHGTAFWENYRSDVIATLLLACSENWGKTRFTKGDKGLNFTPAAPLLSGWGRKASQGLVVDVPPVDLMDNVSDARRRFFLALEYVEKGHSVNLVGGIAPSVHLMCEYFSNPEDLFKEYYDSVEVGVTKLYLLQKRIRSTISGRSRNVRDYLNLKGLMIGGVDTNLYYDYLRTKLGIEPFTIYGITELGLPMFGSPEDKASLLPNLRSCYFEFLDEKGQGCDIKELRVGKIYQLIVTSFGSMFVRYDTKDMVRLSRIRDDGMPIFSFWGRRNAVVSLGGRLPRITESFAVEIMARAGLSLSDKWAVTKLFDKGEKFLFLMENTWGLTERETTKRIYDALYNLNNDFREYSKEFNIHNPEDIIRVEYLKKGAFLRYSMKRGKEGYPIGQIKPPKIIPSERQDICETLREG